jgi:beta-aspartyl-peptidase (threonine type)
MERWALAIHGGAGIIERRLLSPQQDHAYRAALHQAVEVGARILSTGGAAIDAVERAVCVMEDDPLFNAGRGSVLTHDGTVELDASIMDGNTKSAGAVTGVMRTRHPISLARCLMNESRHVMLSGRCADTLARRCNLDQVEPTWFHTEARWQSLAECLTRRGLTTPPQPAFVWPPHGNEALIHVEGKFGTVGAVALDCAGNVAAGTSSGGMNGKPSGRVGDSPIIGAGTYASNASCAVSATGSGEHLIRIAATHEVCALVEHKGLPLQAAIDQVIRFRLAALDAEGGLIAVNAAGQIAWSFNTTGMYRARVSSDSALCISLYGDEA